MSKEINLRERFDELDDQSSLRDIQEYIATMKEARGFSVNSVEREMLLMTEEIGELARAVRKDTGGRIDHKRPHETVNTADELADVLAYLLSVGSMMGVDVQSAYLAKEVRNFDRTWTK